MPLHQCYLFQGLSESHLQQLAVISIESLSRKGQWLLYEGQEAKELYVIKKGAVEMTLKVEPDFEIPIAIFRNPGDCFGTSGLIPPHTYNLSARCVEKGTLLVFKHSDLHKLIQKDHDLGCIVMTNLAQNLGNRLKENRQELKIHFRTLLKSMHS